VVGFFGFPHPLETVASFSTKSFLVRGEEVDNREGNLFGKGYLLVSS